MCLPPGIRIGPEHDAQPGGQGNESHDGDDDRHPERSSNAGLPKAYMRSAPTMRRRKRRVRSSDGWVNSWSGGACSTIWPSAIDCSSSLLSSVSVGFRVSILSAAGQTLRSGPHEAEVVDTWYDHVAGAGP